VFPGYRENKPLVGLWKIWQRVLKLAGVDHARVQDLRHSFGTVAGALGISGPMIQSALNHSSPAMTARYINLKDAQKAEVANAVAEALKAARRKPA
jgi:integrase